jgi:serine/threonine protein phosphatase PrpC
MVAPTLRERSALAKQLRLDVAQLTDVGRKREHNEDNMAYVIPKDPQVMANKGSLFIVADGMGGHAAGEVASEIAVDTISNVYYQDDSDDVAVSLLRAIRRANASIHQRAAENMLRTGMGTTCVAAVLRGNMAYIANVGDSRAYLLRGSQVKQVSQDHSWVAEQVRAGLLTDDQARTHAQRNVITRCLGTQAEVDIDVFHEGLNEGDSLVLCTDGLSGLVSDEELLRIVDQFVPQESVYHLVERANENGGPDNITAIVVRVHEVGEEPPGVRYPVGVGGREVGEDTAILGMFSDVPAGIAVSNGEGRIPSSPLRISSGPLTSSPDSITAPQPVLGKQRSRRGRLFYPTLALIALLVITLTGGGVFYFLRANESQAANQALDNTQQQITRAQANIASDPTSALKAFSTTQNMLAEVKNHQLDGTQVQRLTQLQDELVQQVKMAISVYNHHAKISVLPCSKTSTNPIENTSTHTLPQSLAWAQYPNKVPVLYTLAQDNSLYQVSSQYSLTSRLPSNPDLHILNISSNGSLLFVLVEQLKGALPTGYTLDVYQPGPTGSLGAAVYSTPVGVNFAKDGYTPALTTAWGENVYVVLSQSNATNARVLSYTMDVKGHLNAPKSIEFSVSVPIASIAAFPTQLFLLLSSGEVRSLPLASSSRSSPLPTAVLVQPPIALPLAPSSQDFRASDPVPTVTQFDQQGSAPLLVPSASTTNSAMLTAGQENGTPHLYIGDPVNHRVLDLDFFAGPLVGGPATPTPVPTGTNIAGSSVILQLVQQYVSSTDLNQAKSLAADPRGTQIDVLSQNAPLMMSLVTVNTGQQAGCA